MKEKRPHIPQDHPAGGAVEEVTAPPAGPDDPVSRFGRTLRDERERRGRSAEETARAIRIPVRYLLALEGDRGGELPPRTYVKGFLEAYARYLGLDPDDVYLRFSEALHEAGLDAGGTGAGRGRFRGGSLTGLQNWLFPALWALAVAAFFGWRWSVMPEGPSGAGNTAPPSPGGDAVIDERDLIPPIQPLPEVEEPAAAAPVRLMMRAQQSTWVSARVDGGVEEEWVMHAGEIRSLSAAQRIELSLGNAGVVKLNYNGRELGFVGHKGEVKRDLVFVPESKE